MIDLKSMFPKASKSFLCANPPSLPSEPTKMSSSPSVAVPRVKSMTSPECEMAMILEAKRRRGDIESWMFEGVTLKLADGCRFTPDFFVRPIEPDLKPQFIETKGPFIREDAMIKFRVAKEQNPWAEWQLHQKTRDGWRQIL